MRNIFFPHYLSGEPIFVAIPYKFRPLQYGNESIGRYSKEFGAFLKETYGDIPGDLPYA